MGDLRREARAWGRKMNRQSDPRSTGALPANGTLEVRLQKKPDHAVRDLAASVSAQKGLRIGGANTAAFVIDEKERSIL